MESLYLGLYCENKVEFELEVLYTKFNICACSWIHIMINVIQDSTLPSLLEAEKVNSRNRNLYIVLYSIAVTIDVVVAIYGNYLGIFLIYATS